MTSEQARGDAPSRIPWPTHGWTRLVSIVLAVSLSVLFFTRSHAIAALYYELSPWLPGLLMWGCAIGFIHGVGFVPRLSIWRVVFSPFIGWPLLIMGLILTLSQS